MHEFPVLDETWCLNHGYLDRYTLGYVGIFNMLQAVVFESSQYDTAIPVKEFYSNLNRLLKYSRHDLHDWDLLFNPRLMLHSHCLHLFHNLDSIPFV